MAFHAMTRPEIMDMAGSDIPDTAGRKRKRRRTQAIAKCYVFHAKAIRGKRESEILLEFNFLLVGGDLMRSDFDQLNLFQSYKQHSVNIKHQLKSRFV